MSGREARPRKLLKPLLAATALLLAVGVFNLRRDSVDEAPAPWTDAPVTEPAASAARELVVPVVLDPGTTGVALGLDVRRSRLQSYPSGKTFYTLDAVVENSGATELDEMSVRLELLDAGGAVVEEDLFDAVSRASPVLRPGDVRPLHHLLEAPAAARRARLAVVTVDENPAAGAYAAAKEIDLDWRTTPPADLRLAVRERSYRFSESAFPRDGSGYFDLVVEVENTGERTLRGLELSAEIVGPEEAWTVAEKAHVVVAGGPALRPGEVWLQRFIEKVAARPEGYRMFVVDAR